MRTVGQILQQAREEKFYTLEEIEKATKIRKELLQALEADDYSKLPPSTFVQGFIKNYAQFLKLDAEMLLAIFRRGFGDKEGGKVLKAFSDPLEVDKFKITPGKVLGLAVSLVIISFFAYLWFQYRHFVGAPNLTVEAPVNELVTEAPAVVVEGKTDPESKVLINNQQVAVADDGSFKQEFQLSSDVNKVTIEAVSKFGQRSQVERLVYLKR